MLSNKVIDRNVVAGRAKETSNPQAKRVKSVVSDPCHMGHELVRHGFLEWSR
jgi:hypothetical protein